MRDRSKSMIPADEVRPEMTVRYADKSQHVVRRVHHMVGTPSVLIVHGNGPDRVLFAGALVEVVAEVPA